MDVRLWYLCVALSYIFLMASDAYLFILLRGVDFFLPFLQFITSSVFFTVEFSVNVGQWHLGRCMVCKYPPSFHRLLFF